ncbi:OLC1v1005037C2 [Oldenlandia corymbosa var. corymbosa]|uniref:OLC1v1005037C2 n=1 Tax=Oldenlandia corymbosa var. corymbosa TaxID=529605 RepID=A0AAV1DH53_OLDCO|nr:OLC1v1005037C2 [Oldenlandia corymbosa var. corymbosa]
MILLGEKRNDPKQRQKQRLLSPSPDWKGSDPTIQSPLLNSANLTPGFNFLSVEMGLAAPKRATPTTDEIQQETGKRSHGECISFMFETVPRKRRSDRQKETAKEKELTIASGACWDFTRLPVLFTPEGDNPITIQELPSKNDLLYQRRAKSTSDVSIVHNTTANPSPSRRLRVRGQKRGLVNSCQQGKLDSNTFEIFMEHIWNTCPEESRKSFSYLDCLWFFRYSQKSEKEKVLNWVKKKDIFSKKHILVPIVLWSHWSLLILCNFGSSVQPIYPCVLLLDSLQQTNPRWLEPGIRKFILDIYHTYGIPATMESIRKIPFLIPKVPQQRNGEECGTFVLYYIKLFIENAPQDFSICGPKGYPYFMKEDWFTLEEFDSFWKELEVKRNSMSLVK